MQPHSGRSALTCISDHSVNCLGCCDVESSVDELECLSLDFLSSVEENIRNLCTRVAPVVQTEGENINACQTQARKSGSTQQPNPKKSGALWDRFAGIEDRDVDEEENLRHYDCAGHLHGRVGVAINGRPNRNRTILITILMIGTPKRGPLSFGNADVEPDM